MAAETGIGLKYLIGLAAGSGIAAAMAAFVVMSLSVPKTTGEWRVALASTLMSSICGGAALVRYLNLQVWAYDWIGVMGLIGFVFACGLPGWMVVRSIFNWMAKRESADFAELIRDVKDFK